MSSSEPEQLELETEMAVHQARSEVVDKSERDIEDV